jgi:hypothetical protein
MGISDTSAEARRVEIELYRGMTMAQKMSLWVGMRETRKHLAMAGFRLRHPEASEEEIWHMWASQQLGDELYDEVYGKRTDAERAIGDSN